MQSIHAISFRVIQLLNERDWSAYKLALECGLPHSTLSNIILGKCKSCNFDTILNICRGFRIQPVEFMSSEMFFLENLDDND